MRATASCWPLCPCEGGGGGDRETDRQTDRETETQRVCKALSVTLVIGYITGNGNGGWGKQEKILLVQQLKRLG